VESKKADNDFIKEEERIVFEEINKWLRNINNIVWIVTSFFITLNFLAIRSAFYKPISDFLAYHSFWQNSLLIIIVLFLLWIIPVLFSFAMIVVSKKLYNLINSHLSIDALKSALKFDLYSDTKNLYEAAKYPWAWIIIALTIFFIVIWIWILSTFN
jgi:Ni,Fe-hydrogenase I cytochrome b subunit